jgi:DNA-binding MarR family transcriptional regulator
MVTKKQPQGKAAAPARSAVSALESHLGYWLRFVSNHVSHGFRRKVEGRGVSVSEWVLLRQVYGAEHPSAGAVASAIGMTKGAISKMVTRLEEKGLLTRAPSDSDGRQQLLELTVEGRRLVPELARLADENDAEFFGHLPEAERARLLQAMQQLARHHRLESVPVD